MQQDCYLSAIQMHPLQKNNNKKYDNTAWNNLGCTQAAQAQAVSGDHLA